MFSSAKWPFIFLSLWREAFASVGDSSPFYNHCVKDCNVHICGRDGDSTLNYNVFGFIFSLWTCHENCEYLCQWKTVEAFQRKNWEIPQFKGKWPFIRMFGLQEPASVIFSLLNFFVILKMFLSFKKKVPNTTPYYYVWHFYTIVCLNGWVWSCVYHSRDNDFTERMDYMSAFVMVISSFYTMGLRHLNNTINIQTVLWSAFCGCLTVNHLAYLCFYYFDYEYNMKLNCAIGALTVVGWLLWTFLHYQNQDYAWKASAYAITAACTTLLELLDFPPLLWIADAHSLWHLSTVFINIIFYNFIIDDGIYLDQAKSEHLVSKSKIK